MQEEKIKKKVYITKYFSTLGVIEADAEFRAEDSSCCFSELRSSHGVFCEWFSKTQFYFSKEDAKKDFEKRKKKKILSLKRQIEEMEKINFDI